MSPTELSLKEARKRWDYCEVVERWNPFAKIRQDFGGIVDIIVLDKTGTVTTGAMSVEAIDAEPGEDPAVVLARAAAVESASEHPIAAAVVSAARERALRIPAVTDFANDPGTGVRGIVDGTEVQVARASDSDGRTSVAVSWNRRRRGVIRLTDAVKPTSAAAIAAT